MYQHDPQTGAPPPFQNSTQVIKFLGDGHNGLLGYCQRLYDSYSQDLALKNYLHRLLASIMAGKIAWAANFMTEKNALTDQIKHLQQQISKDKMNLDDGAQIRA